MTENKIVRPDGSPADEEKVIHMPGAKEANEEMSELDKMLNDENVQALGFSMVQFWRAYAVMRMVLAQDERWSSEAKHTFTTQLIRSQADEQGVPLPFDDAELMADLKKTAMPMLTALVTDRNERIQRKQKELEQQDRDRRKEAPKVSCLPPLTAGPDGSFSSPQSLVRGSIYYVGCGEGMNQAISAMLTRRLMNDGVRTVCCTSAQDDDVKSVVEIVKSNSNVLLLPGWFNFMAQSNSPCRKIPFIDVMVVDNLHLAHPNKKDENLAKRLSQTKKYILEVKGWVMILVGHNLQDELQLCDAVEPVCISATTGGEYEECLMIQGDPERLPVDVSMIKPLVRPEEEAEKTVDEKAADQTKEILLAVLKQVEPKAVDYEETEAGDFKVLDEKGELIATVSRGVVRAVGVKPPPAAEEEQEGESSEPEETTEQ